MHTLAIGMAVYDDYDGVYFSIGAIMMSPIHELVKEIIVMDNNPTSKQGKATKRLLQQTYKNCQIKFRYKTYTTRRSTAVRSEIFKYSKSDYTLIMDSHVIMNTTSVYENLKKFLSMPISKDLFHGPLLTETGDIAATEMKPGWNRKGTFYGTWYRRPYITKYDTDPFEIEMHGMGLFMCATNHWLGFSDHTIGWGGEEGYIHTKYRNAGRSIYCLPWLQWIHRFARPNGTPFPMNMSERIYNYAVCWAEVGMDIEELRNFFISVTPNDTDGTNKIIDTAIEYMKSNK